MNPRERGGAAESCQGRARSKRVRVRQSRARSKRVRVLSEPRAKQAGSNRKLNAGKIGKIKKFSYFSGLERFSRHEQRREPRGHPISILAINGRLSSGQASCCLCEPACFAGGRSRAALTGLGGPPRLGEPSDKVALRDLAPKLLMITPLASGTRRVVSCQSPRASAFQRSKRVRTES